MWFYRSAKNLPWALRAHVNESFSRSITKELLQMICGKITLQMIFCRMIVRERAFGPWRSGHSGAEREARRDYKRILQKMAAIFGFSLIGKRDFMRDPKKYTFGKSNFKTFFKTRKFEILPPSTLNSWTSSRLLQIAPIICRGVLVDVFTGEPKTLPWALRAHVKWMVLSIYYK